MATMSSSEIRHIIVDRPCPQLNKFGNPPGQIFYCEFLFEIVVRDNESNCIIIYSVSSKASKYIFSDVIPFEKHRVSVSFDLYNVGNIILYDPNIANNLRDFNRLNGYGALAWVYDKTLDKTRGSSLHFKCRNDIIRNIEDGKLTWGIISFTDELHSNTKNTLLELLSTSKCKFYLSSFAPNLSVVKLHNKISTMETPDPRDELVSFGTIQSVLLCSSLVCYSESKKVES